MMLQIVLNSGTTVVIPLDEEGLEAFLETVFDFEASLLRQKPAHEYFFRHANYIVALNQIAFFTWTSDEENEN